jgi:hypothetical protein
MWSQVFTPSHEEDDWEYPEVEATDSDSYRDQQDHCDDHRDQARREKKTTRLWHMLKKVLQLF